MSDPTLDSEGSWDIAPTLKQHARMVAHAGHPLTWPPNSYAKLGEQGDDAPSPGGQRVLLRSSVAVGGPSPDWLPSITFDRRRRTPTHHQPGVTD